ncbi:MAG: hypothetical protein FWG56_03140 [Desulfovibrionaceae bacterium]|jgi:hypothetical protein|nr:hypothetical protein [Desulfovibrionaceae bacterium]
MADEYESTTGKKIGGWIDTAIEAVGNAASKAVDAAKDYLKPGGAVASSAGLGWLGTHAGIAIFGTAFTGLVPFSLAGAGIGYALADWAKKLTPKSPQTRIADVQKALVEQCGVYVAKQPLCQPLCDDFMARHEAFLTLLGKAVQELQGATYCADLEKQYVEVSEHPMAALLNAEETNKENERLKRENEQFGKQLAQIRQAIEG